MAGEPITKRRQRAIILSPHEVTVREFIVSIHEEAGVPKEDKKSKEEVVETNDVEKKTVQSELGQLQENNEEFNSRMARHFEDANDDGN